MINPTTHLKQLILKNNFNQASLTDVLKQIKNQLKVVSLGKRSILISFLSKYYFLVVQNYLKQLEKFRYEFCYAPLMKNQEKKTRNIGLNNRKTKKKNRQTNHNTQLSIEDIAKQVEEISRVEITIDQHLITPLKEPQYIENKNVVTIPAFHPDIIAQMTEQITNLKNTQDKLSQTQYKSQKGWNPDLFKYQNELALTQKGINLTMERKRITRTEKKLNHSKVRIVDEKINLTQGDSKIQELQLLNSKMKISKEREIETVNYFTNQLFKVNLILRNVCGYIDKIKLKQSQIPTSIIQSSPFAMICSPLHFQQSPNDDIQKELQKTGNFFIIQDSQLNLTKELQENITKRIDEQLYFKKQASLNVFSQRFGISKKVKGQLFYQLMHLDFNLTQSKPQSFGDIIISSEKSRI